MASERMEVFVDCALSLDSDGLTNRDRQRIVSALARLVGLAIMNPDPDVAIRTKRKKNDDGK